MWCSSRTPAGRLFALLAGLAAAVALSGCMTAPADNDMPWNKPQTWEGSPYLPPGMFAPQ